MLIIAVDLATTDDAKAEDTLARSGYVKREVWVKEVSNVDAADEGLLMQRLGVGRYISSATWGRGPE